MKPLSELEERKSEESLEEKKSEESLEEVKIDKRPKTPTTTLQQRDVRKRPISMLDQEEEKNAIHEIFALPQDNGPIPGIIEAPRHSD